MKAHYLIRHDGRCWVIENEQTALAAPTLEELDSKVGDYLREQGLLKKGEKGQVFMAFDNSTMPEWIRQYAQHYFNRIVEIEG